MRVKIGKKIFGDVENIASPAVNRIEMGSNADRGSEMAWKLSSKAKEKASGK
jgi:hypothetical protein